MSAHVVASSPARQDVVTLAFLRDMRVLLDNVAQWAPFACENREGFRLGEFEQQHPQVRPGGPTWAFPVAWNLPCALRYVSLDWQARGQWTFYAGGPDRDLATIILATLTEQDVWARLTARAGVYLSRVTVYTDAIRALDGAIATLSVEGRRHGSDVVDESIPHEGGVS